MFFVCRWQREMMASATSRHSSGREFLTVVAVALASNLPHEGGDFQVAHVIAETGDSRLQGSEFRRHRPGGS